MGKKREKNIRQRTKKAPLTVSGSIDSRFGPIPLEIKASPSDWEKLHFCFGVDGKQMLSKFEMAIIYPAIATIRGYHAPKDAEIKELYRHMKIQAALLYDFLRKNNGGKSEDLALKASGIMETAYKKKFEFTEFDLDNFKITYIREGKKLLKADVKFDSVYLLKQYQENFIRENKRQVNKEFKLLYSLTAAYLSANDPSIPTGSPFDYPELLLREYLIPNR